MALYDDDKVLALKILCSTIPPIVALVTIARLWIKTPARWWYDDLFVTFGVVFMILQQCLLWAYSIYEPPTLPTFYVILLSSQTQVWLARFSLLASINRITTTSHMQTITKAVAGFFTVLYLVTLSQLIWVCQTHLQYIGGVPHCAINIQIPIYQFTAAMVADSILITLPMYIIRVLKEDKVLHRRLALIFIASITTTIVSLVQAILNIKNIGFGVLIAVEMECWVSLLICNLGVIVTAISKVCFSTSGPESTIGVDISLITFSPAPKKPQSSLGSLDHESRGESMIDRGRGIKPQPSENSISSMAKFDSLLSV